MSDITPLLHNSGYAPRASVTWNGPRSASGRSPEPEERGKRWTLITCGYRGRRDDPEGFATLLDVPEAETSRALLRLTGHGWGVDDPEARLLGLIHERILALQLPPVLPRLANKTYDKELRYPGGVSTDLLSVLALQTHSVGSLLLRDGQPQLSRVLWKDNDEGPSHWWRVWYVELFIDQGIRKRLAAYAKREPATGEDKT